MAWSFSTALGLGRVSNLPTIWTNSLVAAALIGQFDIGVFVSLALIMSLFYTAGMYFNDFFDAEIDAVQRPERPIPSQLVTRQQVGFVAVLLMIIALLGLGYFSFNGFISGLILSAAILFYNVKHKGSASIYAAWVMGACRALVYITTMLALSNTIPTDLFLFAIATMSYTVAITYTAGYESENRLKSILPLLFLFAPLIGVFITNKVVNLMLIAMIILFIGWLSFSLYQMIYKKNIGQSISHLIAGMALADALYLSSVGFFSLAGLCIAFFGLTFYLQRHILST